MISRGSDAPSGDVPGHGWLASVFAVALLVRTVVAFFSGKFPSDSDALLTGMRTLDILAGRFHVFYVRVRLGALESYLHVPFVALLGATRPALSFAPLLEGVLAVYFVWLLAKRVFPPPVALVSALFFAVPAVPFLETTSLPWLCGTILTTGTAVLALAAIYDEQPGPLAGFALGVAAGLGLWCSIQTLSCTLAAGLWLLARGRRIPRRSLAITAGGGLLLGGLPWFAYNLAHRFESLRDNYGTDPTRSFGLVFANAFYTLTEGLPRLLTPSPPDGTALLIVWCLLLFHAVAVVWFVASSLRSSRSGPWALPALAALLSVVFFCVSSAGQTRDTTVRFFTLCYPMVAIADGLLVTSLWRRSRPAGIFLATTVLTLHAAAYDSPWSDERRQRREGAADDARLLEFLRGERIDAIIGDYWSVYPFNYLSGGRVRAISADPIVDYHDYGSRLPAHGVRWAVVGDEPGVVERWAARAGPEGTRVQVGRYTVLLPDPNPPAETSAEFQKRLQLSFLAPERIVRSYSKEPPLGLWR
jgi:hypothetical protein